MTLPKLLLAAALLLVALGVGLAVLQPGNLGDEEAGTGADDTTPATSSPTTTPTTAAGVDDPATTTTAQAPGTPSATTPTTRPAGTASSDGGGTGLAGGEDVAADTADGLADTGGTSAVGFAVGLTVAGLVLRRRTA